MNVNTDTLVPISEANQNFSKVARLVDKYGSAVILKNNAPRYVILEFPKAQTNEIDLPTNDEVAALSDMFIKKNKKVYEELAK
ncbi:type II toxin-antitoxin system Phd/YefM family antitoxin [Fannyhessea vaginae]|uniref:type II toxin-antitoxin system Phd/YefM family antitoxin n=1 Tax=Fannyhessea vaginae TaxID=82135 RepID=UPI0023F03624|nr:type II toxin-antitoxin system Phd/YefM family antitoxin [Fannyhessea vaginae]